MSEEQFQVIHYMNRGIIESNIDYVASHDSFVCIVKIGMKIDLDDAYTYKDIMGYLHAQSDFGALLLGQDDSMMLLFRDMKIHQAKAKIQKMGRSLWHQFNRTLDVVAITLIDVKDDYKELLERLEQYYVMSKISKKKKIFYGTKDFSFYEGDSNSQMLQTLFQKLNALKIHNLYQGVPVVDRTGIVAFDRGELILKIDKSKVPFYQGEDFCFLEHDLIPNILRANILRVNPTLSTLSLRDLEFLDSSPVERSGIRVEPDKPIFANLSYEGKDLCSGSIVNISENSLVLKLSQVHLSKLASANIGRGYLMLKCQLPTQKSFITTIKTKATIFRMDGENIIVTIYPSPIARTKLRSYISMQQTALLLDLKNRLKEVSRVNN